MQVEEGRGISNGVEYSYTLSSYQWYASYECRVHRSVLERENVIFTRHFVVDNRFWSMSIDHDKKGKLAAYLFSKNWQRATVHFSFTLMNLTYPEKTKSRGDCYTFPTFNDGWGFSDLSSASIVQDLSMGYLRDDFFDVRLDMRIRTTCNESCALSVSGNSVSILWHLKHLKEMSPSRVCSEKFALGTSAMNLILCPTGPRMTAEDLGIYLHNMDDHPVRVKCSIAALNHDSTSKDMTKERVLLIDARAALGWVKFLKCCQMEDEVLGFVRDSRINFALEITLLNTIEDKRKVGVWHKLHRWIGQNKMKRVTRKPNSTSRDRS